MSLKNLLTVKEVAALLRSARCAGLRELELSSVRIDEIGGEAIWCGLMSQTLERLDLSWVI